MRRVSLPLAFFAFAASLLGQVAPPSGVEWRLTPLGCPGDEAIIESQVVASGIISDFPQPQEDPFLVAPGQPGVQFCRAPAHRMATLDFELDTAPLDAGFYQLWIRVLYPGKDPGGAFPGGNSFRRAGVIQAGRPKPEFAGVKFYVRKGGVEEWTKLGESARTVENCLLLTEGPPPIYQLTFDFDVPHDSGYHELAVSLIEEGDFGGGRSAREGSRRVAPFSVVTPYVSAVAVQVDRVLGEADSCNDSEDNDADWRMDAQDPECLPPNKNPFVPMEFIGSIARGATFQAEVKVTDYAAMEGCRAAYAVAWMAHGSQPQDNNLAHWNSVRIPLDLAPPKWSSQPWAYDEGSRTATLKWEWNPVSPCLTRMSDPRFWIALGDRVVAEVPVDTGTQQYTYEGLPVEKCPDFEARVGVALVTAETPQEPPRRVVLYSEPLKRAIPCPFCLDGLAATAACSNNVPVVTLSWAASSTCFLEKLAIYRDDNKLEELVDPKATQYQDRSVEPGPHKYQIRATDVRREVVTGSNVVELEVLSCEAGRFVRGDADSDGERNLTDGIYVLNFLFLGGIAPPCHKAADANDDGQLNITDPMYLLNYLFLGGPEPPGPFPDCGRDVTDDELACESFPACP